MNTPITYKKRCLIAALVAIIFSIIVYNLAIKKTVQLIGQHQELIEKMDIINEAPILIEQIQKKLYTVNNLMGNSISKGNHEIILEQSSKYVKDHPLSISEFPREHLYNEKGNLLKTNIIVVEGRFIDLLKYLNNMETNNKNGRVISVSFYKNEDFSSGKSKLYLKVLIQNIIQIKNEQ